MNFKKYLDVRLIVLFCLPAFFLLHGINENFGLIPGSVIVSLGIYYFLLTAVLMLVSMLLFRNPSKAGLFSFYLLLIYFFFDAIHDGLKEFFGNGFFSSYKFFISGIFLSLAILAFFLYRTRKNLSRTVQYYTVLCSLVFVFEFFSFVVRSVRNDGQRNDLSSKNVHLPAVENVSKAPDIFFVVFDGYTSSDCLKEQFRYDNSGVDSALVRNGFFLSRKSKSNYSITPFSLSSTFTLDYLSPDVPERKSTSKSFLQAMHTFEQNNVVHYFQKLGYQIKNFGCFDLDGAPTQTIPYFDELPYNQINNQTLTGSINRDISFNWKIKNIFTGGLRVPGSYKQYKRYHLYRNSSNFDSLIAELGKGSDRPRFVYAHVMLPHEPFFLDSMGRQVSDTAMIKNTITFTDGYLAQLKYASSLIQRLIPYCASKEANRVVVIEGDHGFRDYGPETPRDRIFSNLNAYYFSDGDYRLLYDGISPVNTFRVILNKYFGAELPMLKDTSIFIPSPNQ